MRCWAVVAILVALALLPVPTRGQEAAVDLRLKVAKGELLAYQTVLSVQSSRYSGRWAVRVLDLTADGNALIESVVEELRGADGSLVDRIDQPWLGRVRPDGTVAERLLGPDAISDFPFPLPSAPVRVGETWKRSRTMERSGVRVTATMTATLERIEATAEGRMARIRTRSDGRETSPTADVRISLRGSEDILWSIDRGRMTRSTSEVTISVELLITLPDRTIPFSSVVKEAVETRLIDPAALPPAAVPADALIVPAKGIGTALLEQPAEAIAAQLGTPDAEEQPGFKAPAVRWWVNDLVALLDPADSTKLVGLLMADRKCRTEKGIGFGSSEGAVLFAYGMEPVAVTLSMPKVGALRALVYDSQGVAFLIVAQRAEGAAPRLVPPAGTVYASLVFPQWSAARIFTLP